MAGGGLLSYDTLVLAASGAAVGIFYIGPNTFDPSKKIYIVFLHCKNVFDPANFFLDWSEYFCTANIVFGRPKYTCFVIRHCGKQIAKDCLLIRQEQACSRITRLVIDCPIVITSIGDTLFMPRNETRNEE